jgi:hypothetical protein
MKKVVAVAVVAAGVGLSACQQLPKVNVAALVKEIVADTQQACRFVPTAETVINIINAGGPIVGSSEAIANAICNSVGPPPVTTTAAGPPRLTATHLAKPPTLFWGGKAVPINGHFK